MRWRIKKKKGMLRDPVYEKIREQIFREIQEEARALEKQAGKINLPDENDICKPKNI